MKDQECDICGLQLDTVRALMPSLDCKNGMHPGCALKRMDADDIKAVEQIGRAKDAMFPGKCPHCGVSRLTCWSCCKDFDDTKEDVK
jgi:hypothetical protein